MRVNRRQVMGMAAGAALMPAISDALAGASAGGAITPKGVRRMRAFNYRGVRLLDSRSKRRLEATRDFYFNIPNDDILKGFRRHANLSAPGEDMGGWCSDNAGGMFGQWVSGMVRISRATEDTPLREKADFLAAEWGKTMASPRHGHYSFDKFVCGLVDLHEYAGSPDAMPLLERFLEHGEQWLGRTRLAATDADSQGGFFNGEMEWYTLTENLYRAYLLTGNSVYKEFGDLWLYPHYWSMFDGKQEPAPHGFHAYSHVNTLSSLAMAYAVGGDKADLTCLVNAYDYFQRTQCYATGGYGPGEKLMRPNGELGDSIVKEPNAKYLDGFPGRSFETPCGTWAIFKVVRYLMEFTGEARFGDWMERALYNGIEAALPMTGRGRTFYYADYRLDNGKKRYHPDTWPCCSGTYIQDVADYHNIIFYQDAAGLAVNLFMPSEVTWQHRGADVTVTQRTEYPESSEIALTVTPSRPTAFRLRLRVPAWSIGATLRVNGRAVAAALKPGSWADIDRTWKPGDRVDYRLPVPPRLVAIDAQHPRRVAAVCGPVVLVRDSAASLDALHGLRAEDLKLADSPLAFRAPGDGVATFRPFYQAAEAEGYRMYWDL